MAKSGQGTPQKCQLLHRSTRPHSNRNYHQGETTLPLAGRRKCATNSKGARKARMPRETGNKASDPLTWNGEGNILCQVTQSGRTIYLVCNGEDN